MKRFKIWDAILPRPFTADGTATGKVTIASCFGFYVGQLVVIKANSLPDKYLQVKQILSVTEMIVGPRDNTNRFSAIDFYTTALNATIEAPEQTYGVDAENGDVLAAVYENHPIAAIRTTLMDGLGQFYSVQNPFPVVPQIPPLTDIEPDVNFVYGPAYEVLEIREFAPNSNVGDILRKTSLTYGPAYEVLKIKQSLSTVAPEDL